MRAPPGLTVGLFAGRYAIERVIGHGATATVHLARDTERGTAVAIKLLRPELAESRAAERFLREIRRTTSLQHPNIAPVIDSGDQDGQLYCVLPYMEGGTLRQLLQREKSLELTRIVEIARPIADALDYAHKQGLVHRDVKPENILFTAGRACLGDFGIARALEMSGSETSSTSKTAVRGTPAYMSPEQAAGGDLDGRSDVYSLACVLYEMVTGMAAFMGPTPESVISQRFAFPPRELRVYRPTAPVAVEPVLRKALALTPADRFRTATTLVDAFERALTEAPPAPEVRDTRRVSRPIALGITAAVLASAIYLVVLTSGGDPTTRDLPDTTRIAVMPFEGSGFEATQAPPHELLHSGLRRWTGVTIVPVEEVSDEIRRRRLVPPLNLNDADEIAASLRAARYVVGRMSREGSRWLISAQYRDVNTGVLHTSEVRLSGDSARAMASFHSLADSLVLRGGSDGTSGDPSKSRNLFATLTLIKALRARDDWDLATAESLFVQATELDPGSARAHLWLAQVRSWLELPSDRWVAAAERSLIDSASLTLSERYIARGLVALAGGRPEAACTAYRSLITREPANFVGWYGVGECHRRDSLVIADVSSPSGWRYRSSYHRAVEAYARAFELLPSTYHGFEARSYSRLHALLFTSPRRLRRGVGPNGQPFLARPRIVGETLVMVPFEQARILSGDPKAAISAEAISRQRRIFHSIAARWASAFRLSASAKEAVAISLELQGERTALDSMRVATKLASNPLQRLQLAAASVMLQVKFAIPDRLDELKQARAAADSIVRAVNPTDAETAAFLAPLAALLGRCELAASLLRRATPVSEQLAHVAQDVVEDMNALYARTMLGCSTNLPTPNDIARRVDLPRGAEATRTMQENALLGRSVRARRPPDSVWISRLQASGDYLLKAQYDALVGRPDQAREALLRIGRTRRTALPGDIAPEGVLNEALLWLQLGDSSTAREGLEASLNQARFHTPMTAHDPATYVAHIASLVRSMALLAELEAGRTERAKAWSNAVRALWSSADAELRPLVRRMDSISKP